MEKAAVLFVYSIIQHTQKVTLPFRETALIHISGGEKMGLYWQ